MDNFVYYNDLFDIYGLLLTDKNKEIFSYYYRDNLSMQEIADLLKVSKSYVGTSIKNSIKKLDDLEHNLNIYKNKQSLLNILEENNKDVIKNKLQKLIEKM